MLLHGITHLSVSSLKFPKRNNEVLTLKHTLCKQLVIKIKDPIKEKIVEKQIVER